MTGATPHRHVRISVEWGFEMHDCPMSIRTLGRVLGSKPGFDREPYWYEGKRFSGKWHSDHDELGSLLVDYDGGGVGLLGELDDVKTRVNENDVKWCDLVSGSQSRPRD